MTAMIKKLREILTKSDKKLLVLLMLFSLIISIIETVGISIIMPFIAIASDFSLIHSNEYYKYLYQLASFENDVDFVIFLGGSLIIFYFLRSGINFLYVYAQARFTHGRYYLIVYRLFENYMGMSYKNFVTKNSSTLTKSIINEAAGLISLTNSCLIIFSEFLVMIFIYSMMLYVNLKITLLITLFLLLNAIFMTKTISKKIKNAGAVRASIQKYFYEIINRTFGNFKLIKLQNNDIKVMNEFSLASLEYSKSNIIYTSLGQLPRLLLEAIGFGMIVAMIVFFVWEKGTDIKSILPIISMFVLALYRLMPSVNRIMTGYNLIMFNHKSLDIIHNDLMYDSEELGAEKLCFKKEISLVNIDFEHIQGDLILRDISIKIEFNDLIAFVGESGSGKSTLVDIIMGLHKPLNGNIYIDERQLDESNLKDWRSKIGYIPQNVYLFDGSIAENIVFGRIYNERKIIECLKNANIYDFVLEKDGLETFVGEGGIMVSGGQKQRIAIARALYGEPEILILDEATSALDEETELKIMDEIYEICKNKTLIIIAHRLSTIARCKKIFTLDNGKIA